MAQGVTEPTVAMFQIEWRNSPNSVHPRGGRLCFGGGAASIAELASQPLCWDGERVAHGRSSVAIGGVGVGGSDDGETLSTVEPPPPPR